MVYLDEIDEYVTKEEYLKYLDYQNVAFYLYKR